MDNNATELMLKEFDKVFESARFYQNYHITAFNYFMAISGGAAALLLSTAPSATASVAYSLLFVVISLIFFIYNRRIEKHMAEYYSASWEIARELGMSRLLGAQDRLQHRLIGFSLLIRSMYIILISTWVCLFAYNVAKVF
jgi:hypothetical protein